jgi:hypothetical protein
MWRSATALREEGHMVFSVMMRRAFFFPWGRRAGQGARALVIGHWLAGVKRVERTLGEECIGHELMRENSSALFLCARN